MALRLLLLAAPLLVKFVLCDTEMGFVFPPNATNAYEDTAVANISVHFNDNITLEYNFPDTNGQVSVFQTCFSSIKAMEDGSTYENVDTCNPSHPFPSNRF